MTFPSDHMNSRAKGAAGEREWRDQLRAAGYTARRGQQFSGGTDSPDVVCEELGQVLHFEVKRVERLNLEVAMDQARKDGAGKVPVVAHRRNNCNWLVTIPAEAFFSILKDGLEGLGKKE
jgi:Holliday junction resolvase